MDLKYNIFYNNSAIYGGGGIYFTNKILPESPSKSNSFSKNTAHDFYTFPTKILFQDDRNFKSWVNKYSYNITIIPGITEINLNLSIRDYYGNILKLNRFLFSNNFFSALQIYK